MVLDENLERFSGTSADIITLFIVAANPTWRI